MIKKPRSTNKADTVPLPSDEAIAAVVEHVAKRGAELYRDFSWRQTSDPYAVLVSEVMLQQTQTVRVVRFFERWIERFPTCDALASASVADVLSEWQGLGYNRRALMLKRACEQISESFGGVLPDTLESLVALPGIGPATAAGVMAFAHNVHAPYLETNVRAVFLHELWPEEDKVSDKYVFDVVKRAAEIADELGTDARTWNYALLDYGVWLKKEYPNPSRRSKHHTVQSAYEGSRRQKRASLLREILGDPGQKLDVYAQVCKLEPGVAQDVLEDLVAEGFLVCENDTYTVA